MSHWLLKKYRKEGDALLKKHEMNVSENTAVALAKQIRSRRWPADKEARTFLEQEKSRLLQGNRVPERLKKAKPGELDNQEKEPEQTTATPGIKKAINPARKLVGFAERNPTRPSDKKSLAESVQKCRKKLKSALSDPYVVLELSLCQPPIDVNRLLGQVTLSRETLVNLLEKLTAHINSTKQRPGRPKEVEAFIIASAVHTWVDAGREERFSYIEITEQIKGPFIDFLRDLFDLCAVQIPTDPAIKSRLIQPINLFDAMKNRHF